MMLIDYPAFHVVKIDVKMMLIRQLNQKWQNISHDHIVYHDLFDF